MQTSILLMSKLTAMLVVVLLGIIIVRTHLLSEKDSKTISSLTVYILQPAMIVYAFELELTQERLRGFIAGLVFSMIVYIVWILAVTILKKPLGMDAIDQTTLIYSNVGNLTLPIVMMTLGEEMVFYASILTIPFNIFAWTHGASVIGGRDGINLKKIVLNPNVIALLVGVVILVSGIRFPDVINTTLSTLGDAVPAMSMIVVGMVIGSADIKSFFSNAKAYAVTFGRLVAFPVCTMFALYLTGFLEKNPELVPVFQVIFMGLSAPPASTVSQLAVLYDENPMEASVYNTFGMFACIITIPVMNLLFELLFIK